MSTYAPKPEKPTHEGGDDLLQFVISKINRGGHKKTRIVSLNTRSRTLVSCSTKGQKTKTLQLKEVARVERSYDKRKCGIYFEKRAAVFFTFADAAVRERFLGRLTTLWELALEEKASLPSSSSSSSSSSASASTIFALPSSLLASSHSSHPLPSSSSIHARNFDPQNIKMIVLTWNVGESLPPSSAILSMCFGGENSEFDMYVVCLQECSKKKEQWCSAIKFYLEFGGLPFVVVKEARLWDMVILVLAKESLSRLINHVEADHVACGVGDVLGNKGGIGVSLCINDTSFCFLNCHLAARAERIVQRQANFMRIVRSLQLGLKSSDILNQFDHVIWAGDLNYRVDAEFQQTIEDLQQKRWAKIFQNDQLNAEMQKMNVFVGFKEGPLEFAPTYRWDRATNEISNKREQTPSWTDRILWKSLAASELVFKNYKSAPDAVGSDHRPVFATFEVHPRTPYTGVNLFSNLDGKQDNKKHIELLLLSPLVKFENDVLNAEKITISVNFSSYILSQSVYPPLFVHLKDNCWGYTENNNNNNNNNVNAIELLPFIHDRRTVKKSFLIVSLSLVSGSNTSSLLTATSSSISALTDTTTINSLVEEDRESRQEAKMVEDSKLDPKAGLLGCAIISLEHAFDEHATFHAMITHSGQPVGEFSGKFHVVTKGTAGWQHEIPPLKPVRSGGMLSSLFSKTATIFQDANDGVEVNADTDAADLTHISFPFHTIKEKWLFFAEEYLTPQKDPGPVAALHGALCCLKDLYCLGGGAWAKDLPIQVGLIKATSDCGNSSVSMGLAWIYFRNKPDNQALGVLNCGTGGVRLQLYVRTKGTVSCLLEYKPAGAGKGVFSNLRVGSYSPTNVAKEQSAQELKEEISTLLLNAPWNNVKLRVKLAKQFKIRTHDKLHIPLVAFVSGTIRNYWEKKLTADSKEADMIEEKINSVLESVVGSESYASSVLALEGKRSFFIKQRVEGQMELVGCRALYSQFAASKQHKHKDKESVSSSVTASSSSTSTAFTLNTITSSSSPSSASASPVVTPLGKEKAENESTATTTTAASTLSSATAAAVTKPLEPVISFGIGKGSSQWTSLYYVLPDAYTRYSLEPAMQFGMDKDEFLAERLATAIVAQYRPYQEGLRKMMISVLERGNVPCFALKSGCLLMLDDGLRDLKGVSSGKIRRRNLVDFPSALSIPAVDVVLSRRSGFSVSYVLTTNSVAVVCADACSLLVSPGEDPRPQFLKVNVKGETAFLSDLAAITAGTELVFSTAHELLGKPAPLPLKEKERRNSISKEKILDITTTTAEFSLPEVLLDPEQAEFDLAMIGTGRTRRVTPAEDPTEFFGKRKPGETPKLEINALLSMAKEKKALLAEKRNSTQPLTPTHASASASSVSTMLEEKKAGGLAEKRNSTGIPPPPPSLSNNNTPEKHETSRPPVVATPMRKEKSKQSSHDDNSGRGLHHKNKHSGREKVLSDDEGFSDDDAGVPVSHEGDKHVMSPSAAKSNSKSKPRRGPDNVDMYDVYRLDF